ncbi:hypothetical protein ACSBQT_10520 [Brevibacterium sp. H602]|uniref:hypothetical protein n=1 Tax=unclassified Brevibacterium TaxID=2614124 RepID=UPI00397A94FE
MRFATFALKARAASARGDEIADFSGRSSLQEHINQLKQHVSELPLSRQSTLGCDPMHIFE